MTTAIKKIVNTKNGTMVSNTLVCGNECRVKYRETHRAYGSEYMTETYIDHYVKTDGKWKRVLPEEANFNWGDPKGWNPNRPRPKQGAGKKGSEMTPKRLKSIRLGLGISQAEMARRLGVQPSRISEWQAGVEKIPAYMATAIRERWGHINAGSVDIPPITAEKISEIRRRYMLSRRKFGEVIGRSESAIFLYEKGARTPPDEVRKKFFELDKIILDNPSDMDYIKGQDGGTE